MFAKLCELKKPSADKTQTDIDADFKALADRLGKVKNKMNHIPKKAFQYMMTRMDRYYKLKKHLNTAYNMSVSTNASLKMYEMLALNPMPKLGHITAFCNAEFPGAFISGINHFATNRAIPLKWVASSFWPSDQYADSSIFKDEYGLYRKYKENWLMGPRPDGSYISGDVCQSEVILALSKSAQVNGPINLYTSDAGIDVSSNYNKQEELTCAINYGQILCGLLSLAPGGVLVTKQYTFFIKFNRALLYKLFTVFDRLYITKPATSRPVNSEIYLIGVGFKGISESDKTEMLKISDDLRAGVNLSDVTLKAPPLEFDYNTYLIATALYDGIQIPAIAAAIEAHKFNSFKDLDGSAEWIAQTNIKPIDASARL